MEKAIKEKLVPELRFPQFDQKWEARKLGNICSKIGSGSTPKGGIEVYTKTGIPFIRSQNVLNNSLVLDKTHISNAIHSSMKGSTVLSKDILLNITGGSIGRSCVVPENFNEGNVNQHVAIIRLKNDNSKFLQNILSSSLGQKLVFQSMTGSGREGLNFESIRNFNFNIPSLPEQQKIASFLTKVDEKIAHLSKKKALLEDYKKGVTQQIFKQEIRFKIPNEAGELVEPPKWEQKKLGEIGFTYNGLSGKVKEDFGNGKPYIQYKQIFDDSKIDISRFEFVKIALDEKQNKVEFGDAFFTVSSETPNEIGTASVLLDEIEELYLNSFCFGYRSNSLLVLSPYFSRYLFRNNVFRKEIVKLAQGSTRYNMSKIQLMKLVVQLPCIEEQTKIANFLSSIDKKIETVNTQLSQAKTWKKGLLQKMFV